MIIFTGRFQPFHNGHLDTVRQLVEKYPDEKVCVAIVVGTNDSDKVNDDFDKIVKDEWSRKSPIWSQEVCVDIVGKTLKREFGERVSVVTMPRASRTNWDTITKLFNCKRIWAFTQDSLKIDSWEEAKCEFYRSMGDQVIRVPIRKTINGTDIRKAINSGDLTFLKKSVPKEVYNYFGKTK